MAKHSLDESAEHTVDNQQAVLLRVYIERC
jgi:hypothetical protein